MLWIVAYGYISKVVLSLQSFVLSSEAYKSQSSCIIIIPVFCLVKSESPWLALWRIEVSSLFKLRSKSKIRIQSSRIFFPIPLNRRSSFFKCFTAVNNKNETLGIRSEQLLSYLLQDLWQNFESCNHGKPQKIIGNASMLEWVTRPYKMLECKSDHERVCAFNLLLDSTPPP